MAKDPAFLFYTNDFLSGTQFFSDEQLGKYLRLLMAQHQMGHLEEKHMIQICKTYDKDVFLKFKRDSNGLYYNERLENEIIKRKNYTQSRSDNRKSKKTYDEHMENRNENININMLIIEEGENFSEKIKSDIQMVVVEMYKIWQKKNPMYPMDKERDYSSLLQFAYKIAETKGWKRNSVISSKELDVLKSWEKICDYLMQDNWLKTKPLSTILTQWQGIVMKMNENASKTKIQTNGRIITDVAPEYAHLGKTSSELAQMAANGELEGWELQ